MVIDEEAFNYVLRNVNVIKESNEITYNLIENSCVDFTNMVASALNIQVPKPELLKNLPQMYISKLIEGNTE